MEVEDLVAPWAVGIARLGEALDGEKVRRHRRHLEELAADEGVSLVKGAVDLVFVPGGPYVVLAGDLVQCAARARTPVRGHELCVFLDGAAKALDGSTVVQGIKDALLAALEQAGAPRLLAMAISRALGGVAGRLATLAGTAHVVLLLRAIGALVCPDLEECPARGEVLEAFGRPPLAATLRSLP